MDWIKRKVGSVAYDRSDNWTFPFPDLVDSKKIKENGGQ